MATAQRLLVCGAVNRNGWWVGGGWWVLGAGWWVVVVVVVVVGVGEG